MQAKHTPGPWAIKWHENTDGYTVYVSGKNWESWAVADVCHTTQDEHNVRLIAAAPELLDALQQALEEAIFPSKQISNVYERAQAAIAKATGASANASQEGAA